AAEVAAGVELVPRGCRMDVVDAEAHRCPLSGGQPRVMFDERHRGRGHGALPEPVTRVAAIGSSPVAAFLAALSFCFFSAGEGMSADLRSVSGGVCSASAARAPGGGALPDPRGTHEQEIPHCLDRAVRLLVLRQLHRARLSSYC